MRLNRRIQSDIVASRVLVIERSATLRHILGKTLSGEGYQIDVAHTYEAGQSSLGVNGSSDTSDYRGIVLGWPTHTEASADELLSVLEQPPLQDQPVVVMAHEPVPAMRTWVSQRPRTAFILWDNHTEVVDSLAKLLVPGTGMIVPKSAPDLSAPPIRILFVDDSPSIRVYYRRLLKRQEFIVETASSVEEALDKARTQAFDIAIIDYFMPDANGDVLCRAFKDDPATAGIITTILTGTYSDQVIKDCLDAGAVECMFKNEAEALFLARLAAMSRLSRAKKSIETERQRLAGILRSVGDGVYGVDNSGAITFMNPAAMRILGHSDDKSLIGESPHALFHYANEDGSPRPTESCRLHQAYGSNDELRSWETVFWHSSKRPIPVECTVFPLEIDRRIEGSVIAFRDISERKSLEEKLRWQATHDPLTELLNRRHFEERLETEVRRLKRTTNEASALLHIDLDRFKYINDTAGHSTGDRLLVEVGKQLRGRLRNTDVLARLGGDEFAVLLCSVDVAGVHAVADAFRETLTGCEFSCNGTSYRINVSIGAAVIDSCTHSPGDVLANADIACNIAKRKGRNQTHVFVAESDERVAMDLDLGWSTRLRQALDRDQFTLFYQPILPMCNLNVHRLPEEDGLLWRDASPWVEGPEHFEALVRLKDEHGDIISPHAFIPTAERFNMMQEIDFWVLRNAVAHLAALREKGRQTIFSINLSGHTLDDERLLPLVTDLIGEYGVPPSALIFEVTETAAISCLESATRFITELRNHGCHFALDDFGSGFSSFSHLKHLPVDYIKIDGTFVQGMAKDPIDRAMVASMNDIAHSLGRRTIAEYVENAEIVRLLKECGVDYMQGYYISEPLAADRLL